MGGSIKILSTEEAFDGKDFEVQFCKCSYEKCLSNKLPETGRGLLYCDRPVAGVYKRPSDRRSIVSVGGIL